MNSTDLIDETNPQKLMILEEIQTSEGARSTSTLPQLEEEQEFNWKNCWYPVAFVQDLPKNGPYSFSLYDEPFVLFANQDGKLAFLIDRCPHRAAKLSDGQIIDFKSLEAQGKTSDARAIKRQFDTAWKNADLN